MSWCPRHQHLPFLSIQNYPGSKIQAQEVQDAAAHLGVKPIVFNTVTEPEIETAFATLTERGAAALVVAQDATLFAVERDHLVALAASHSIPTIYWQKEFVTAGGLISYGIEFADGYRQVGIYVGRILKGEKPADLPVVQPTKFNLVINLKTAKALGLTVPQTLLVAADEVIE